MRSLRFVVLCFALLSCLSLCSGAGVGSRLKSRLQSASQAAAQTTPNLSPFEGYPHMSLLEFHEEGVLPGADPMEQVRSVIPAEDGSSSSSMAVEASEDSPAADSSSFLEVSTGVSKVRSFCEICILVMQMKERGQPHLCAGLNTNYHITCIEVLESILRADKAIVYWLKNGCMHMDADGPEIVRPCPAMNVCSWVPNLFADAPSLVRDGVESLCPKDPKFLPTIPQEFRNLLGATDNTAGSAKDGPVDPTTSGL